MPFGNPILAGDTLIRVAMQSENFQSGVAGWRIERLGNAEFNDVTVRGRLVTTGPNGTVTIDDGKITAVGSTYTTEIDDGRILIFSNSIPDLSFTEFGPAFITLQDLNGDTGSVELSDGDLYLTGTGGDGVVVRGGLAGQLQQYRNGANEGFNTVSAFSNSWVSAAAPNGPVEYKRYPDQTVGVSGRAANGTNTAGTTVFTLPSGYRPRKTQRFCLANGGGLANGDVEIATNGAVIIRRAFGSASIEFDCRFDAA
jgi:hypothetical protein